MNSENPKVTVLMPVYNGERHLREAIESILTQAFTDFEFLIINDGSTDHSAEIVESYTDPRIRLMHNEQNSGLIATLNNGIDLAQGKYIARMDCDDISLSQRLSRQVKFLDENPDCAVVAVKIVLINADGREIGDWKGDRNATTEDEIRRRLPIISCIAHPGVMIRKPIIAKYRYDPSQHYAEDYDLWLRIASDGYQIAKIDEVLLKYRVHSAQITSINNHVRFGLANIRIKANFLLGRIVKFKFGSFELRVLLGLFQDLVLLVPKLIVKSFVKN